MRYMMLLAFVVLVTGCAQRIQEWTDNPATFLADPGFKEYRSRADRLEKLYLNKKITYAEYLDRKKALDDTYAKEVQAQQRAVEDPGVLSTQAARQGEP